MNAPHPTPFRRLISAVMAVSVLAMTGAISDAQTNREKEVVALRLIRQLGSPKFMVRERATQQLVELGTDVVPLLAESSDSRDREIRERSRRVLRILREQTRIRDLERFRLGQATLPGWTQFAARYGESEAGRALFGEIAMAEWQLLEDVFGGPATPPVVAALVSRRLRGLSPNHQDHALGTMVGLFYIATEFSDAVSHKHLHFFARHPSLRTLLTNRDPRQADSALVRNILGQWLLTSRDATLEVLGLQTAVSYHLPEGNVIARRILVNKLAHASSRRAAMEALVALEDPDVTELLEPFLNDETVLGRVAGRERQLRDVALACLMLANRQDLEKIGVKTQPGPRLFDHSTLGYRSESDRQQALKHYRAVKAQGFPPIEANSVGK